VKSLANREGPANKHDCDLLVATCLAAVVTAVPNTGAGAAR
jgi:hypothetical protein